MCNAQDNSKEPYRGVFLCNLSSKINNQLFCLCTTVVYKTFKNCNPSVTEPEVSKSSDQRQKIFKLTVM